MIQASTVRSKVEDLTNLFSDFAQEVEKENGRSRLLDEMSKSLEEKKRELEDREKKINEKEIRQQEERDYLARTRSEANKREDLLNKRQIEVNILNTEYTSKKDELLELNAQLTTQLEKKDKLSKELEAKEADLVRRESLIAKEIAIDRERKLQLDIREKKIRQREAELQRVMGS